MSVRCGLAKRLFDAQKTLAKLTPKQQRKRRLAKKPCDSNSDRFKQAKLIKFFVSELDPTQTSNQGSSDYEADQSSCNSGS